MFKNTMTAVRRFLCEEDGPTAVEYAVLVSLVIGVCFTSVVPLVEKLNASFDSSSGAISDTLLTTETTVTTDKPAASNETG